MIYNLITAGKESLTEKETKKEEGREEQVCLWDGQGVPECQHQDL